LAVACSSASADVPQEIGRRSPEELAKKRKALQRTITAPTDLTRRADELRARTSALADNRPADRGGRLLPHGPPRETRTWTPRDASITGVLGAMGDALVGRRIGAVQASGELIRE
jgi:hypothetical protein